MLLWSYFSVVATDPGGVPPGWRPELDIEKSDGNEAAIAEASPLSAGDSSSHIVRHCRKCNQYKPPRSHHCSVCMSPQLHFDSSLILNLFEAMPDSSWGWVF